MEALQPEIRMVKRFSRRRCQLCKAHDDFRKPASLSEPARLSARFVLGLAGPAMRTKKPPGLISPTGLTKLVAHAAMGVAMGLLFALVVTLINPSGIVIFAGDGANPDHTVSLGALVLTFAIGATLTGVIFMMTENNDS
jgi:hypothetical protein